jgi:hypothetical protein
VLSGRWGHGGPPQVLPDSASRTSSAQSHQPQARYVLAYAPESPTLPPTSITEKGILVSSHNVVRKLKCLPLTWATSPYSFNLSTEIRFVSTSEVILTNQLSACVIWSEYEMERPTSPGLSALPEVTAKTAAKKMTMLPMSSRQTARNLERDGEGG